MPLDNVLQQKENLLNVEIMVYNTEFDCMVDYINYYKAVAAQTEG